MNIQPKTITETKSFTTTNVFTLDTLNDSHTTNDNPTAKTLLVYLDEASPQQMVVISGAEYDALGQWTDDILNNFLVNKYGLAKE